MKRLFFDQWGDATALTWILSIVAIFAALCLGLAQLVYQTDKKGCRDTAHKLGYEWDHGFWTGCLVQTDDGWVDIEKVRVELDG